MFCNPDELMTSLLWFLQYIIDQFRNTCDITKFTGFLATIFIPCDKMSAEGDVSSARSVDLSRRNFRAMIYCDCCHGKPFQECFQSLKYSFADQSRSKTTVFSGSDCSCYE